MTTATQRETKTLIYWIDALKRHRSKSAVVTFSDDDIRHYTYAELSHDVLGLANGLAERGVQRDDLVGLIAESSPASIAACLAIVKAGAIPVPIDAQLETATLEHVLNDSEPGIVFTAGKHRERFEKIELERSPDLILLDEPDHPQHWRQLLTDYRNDFPEPDPDDTAVLFYTSGTTGPPKGVPLSHRNVSFQIEAVMEANVVSEEDRVLLPLPLHHVYPYVIGMLTPLAMGLQIVLPPSLTGPQIVRALREGDVTVVIGVPRLYRALVGGVEAKAEAAGWMAKLAFATMLGLSTRLRRTAGMHVGKRLLGSLHKQFGPNLRVLASGGSPLDDELAWKLEGMGWQVAIGYGLTETSPLLTINPPGGIKIGSVGRAVPGVALRLDPSAMPEEADETASVQAQRVGQGELLAKGPGVFSGYRGLPEKTEEVFTEDGWFRTGDLGSIDDDGWVYVTGRASTLIVTEAGENVQPDELEAAYSESPVIREVGVLEDQGRLVGLIVPDMSELRDAAGSAEDVEKAVRKAVEERSKRLPSYQRLADIGITRETIPRTRLGKIQRHKLRQRYQQAKQGGDGRQPARPLPIEEMSTEDRQLLDDPVALETWQMLADNYPDRRLTPDTSPQIDLGIDSLQWLNLSMELGQRTGVELDEEAIGRIGTVRDLLQELAGQSPGGAGERAAPLEDPEQTLSDEQKRWLQPQGALTALAARAMFGANRILMRGVFRLAVRGAEHLPSTGPVVIVPNHVSHLDPMALAAAMDSAHLRDTYWGGLTGIVMANPLMRLLSRLARVVPVDPKRAVASSLAFGAAVLRQEKNLVWFPEGERSRDGQLKPFKPGLGLILSRYPVTVVPAFIRGSYEALPRDRSLPRPTKITVTFGPVVPADDLRQLGDGEEPHKRIVDVLHERVAALRDSG